MSNPLCISPIDCDRKNIGPEEALRRLVQADENGCAALNVVVATPDDPAILFVDCTNGKYTDWQSLFYQMITLDDNGNWALRVIESAL